MTPLAVVEDLDILEQIAMGIGIAFTSGMIHQFRFEDMKKRLGHSIVPTVAFATHALYETMRAQYLGNASTSILDAPIRMEDQALGRCRDFPDFLQLG